MFLGLDYYHHSLNAGWLECTFRKIIQLGIASCQSLRRALEPRVQNIFQEKYLVRGACLERHPTK